MTEEADSNESRILEEPIEEAEATSCDDIPDFAVLCSFLDRFGSQLGIPCSIREVQIMLEQQGNVSEQLIDIHVKLLRKILSGANKVRFDKHLARFCESFLTPYNFSLVVCLQNEGYAKLDLASKVHILKGLLELQFDFNTKFKQTVNEKTSEELRLLPLGRDVDGMVYWLQVDEDLNVRLFSEDLDDEHSFKLLHKTKEELGEFIESLRKLKGEKFKGDNTPKRPMVHPGKKDAEDTKPTVKEDPLKSEGTTDEKSELGSSVKLEDVKVKKEVEEKKELVEDLCIRQNENSRSSGENQPAVKTKLENEAHCPPVKAEAPVDGEPEAAHSASGLKEVLEGADTAATDLSIPHLPTPPHEQEQRLPAPPQSAVHSPPVPHKKKTADDDKTDHAAEDLRTGKKDDDPAEEGDEEDQTEKSPEAKKKDTEDVTASDDVAGDKVDDSVAESKDRSCDDTIEKMEEGSEVQREGQSDVQNELATEAQKEESEAQLGKNVVDEENEQSMEVDKKTESELMEEAAEKAETSEAQAKTGEYVEEEDEEEQEDAEGVQTKKRGKGRPKRGQVKEKSAAGTGDDKKPKTAKGRKSRKADDDDEDYNGGKPAKKSKTQTDEAQNENDQEEEEQPKKPKKLSREARMLLAEAERLRKAEEDADTEGRPRRSCRMRREVEKYAVSDDEASKKKRKSKADKEEEKEVVFVTGKNAKNARKAAKEMLKAQKLAHKEYMKKLNSKKKKGRKGESDDDELDSMDGLLYGEEYEENEEDVLNFDDNDEDEFACDEDIPDGGEFTHEEVKKARTAKKADETKAAVDDEPCRKCNKSDHPEFILLCDSCDAGYHMSCLKPALMVIPLGNWYCPPCEHDALIEALNGKLSFIEAEWEKRQKEITRKQRLAFVSINIGNVLPSSKRENNTKKTFADEDDFDDEESELSEVGSSDDDGEYSDDSSGQPRRRRAARRGDAIREKMQEYDKLMREAIDDEEEDVEQQKNSPARKRSGKDMSNILPESDEEGVAKKTKRRRKSKLSDLNAADSEEDSDDSEFQASDYSDIEINKRKPKKGRSRKFATDDDEEEDSEAGSDASWGRSNIRGAKRAASRRKNPLAREKSSKKGGSRWDDWDSEASGSFKASSDDSGDFCKPRKRQTVNYAESSEEEDEKPRASARRKKPSDDEVSIHEEEEEEEDDDETTPEEDASNEDDRSGSEDDDDDDEEDEDEEDDDGSDSDAVARRKKKKLAHKSKGKKSKALKKSRGSTSNKKGGKSTKKKSPAKSNKRKKKKNLSDDEDDSDDGSEWDVPKRKSKSQKVAKADEDFEPEGEDGEGEGEAVVRRNGRTEANKARAKIIESDDNEEEEDEEEEDDEDEDAPKAWPPLPSHLRANMAKPKKQEADVPATASKPGEARSPTAISEPALPRQKPETPESVAGPAQPAPVSMGAASTTVFATVPSAALATSVIPAVVIPSVPSAVVATVVPNVLSVAPPLTVAAHPMAAAHNGLRTVYPTNAPGLVQYPPTAGQPSENLTQYYQAPGYSYPTQYAYPPHHQAPPMPGYPGAAYSGAPYAHESFSEWGPSGPQAQVVASAVEDKPSENFSISNILQQGDTNEEMDSVTSIGNLMGK